MSENPATGPNDVPPPTPAPPPSYGTTPPPSYGTTPPPAYGAPAAPPPAAYGAAPPPAYGAPAAPGYAPPGAVSVADSRMWAMLANVLGIIFGFLAPLIIWLIYKDRDDFIKDQSQEALNWQITLTIGYVISSILAVIIIGVFTALGLWIAAIVFGIMGGMAANRGERYRYPWALRLIK